jgi:predicted DNA-binding protein
MSEETSAVISKKKDDSQYDLHVRLSGELGKKLNMLAKETGRSRKDIVEILLEQAKVGEYTE